MSAALDLAIDKIGEAVHLREDPPEGVDERTAALHALASVIDGVTALTGAVERLERITGRLLEICKELDERTQT